jgi:flagellar biogenesis protein FliO
MPAAEQSVYSARMTQPPMAMPSSPTARPVPRSLPPVDSPQSNNPTNEVEPAIFDSGYATSEAGVVLQAASTDEQQGGHRSAKRSRLGDRRVLAPNNKESSRSTLGETIGRFGSMESVSTTIAALVLVLGLFLLVVALLRRTGSRSSASLPQDVVGVLGRVPFPGRQSAYLIRLGNKLLLVSVTPNSAETLSEVTDPAEVNRLLQLCHHFGPTTAHESYQPVSYGPRRALRDA